MVKKNAKKSNGSPKGRVAAQSKQRMMVRLDDGARKHVRLMMDPCNGPLVRPAYEYAGGGFLVRYRSSINLATEATATAFLVGFLPHENKVLYRSTASSSAAAAVVETEPFSALLPAAGGSTLSYRCVAACAKLICLASELNRAGIVAAGSVEADVLVPTDATQGLSVDSVVAALPITTRMPARSMEVLWTPGDASGSYHSQAPGGSGTPLGTQENACVIAGAGLPAASGVRIEFTAVYEVRPTNAANVVAVLEPPPSTNSWNQVLREFIAYAGHRVRIEGERAAIAGLSYLGQRMAASSMPRLEL